MNIEKKQQSLNIKNIDYTIHPGTDFDNFANGGWKASNQIPKDKSRFGTFDKLRDEAEKQVQELFTDINNGQFAEGSNAAKVATLYRLGMDESTIEKQGYSPIKSTLNEIESISSTEQLQSFIFQSHANGNGILFNFFGSADKQNSDFVIGQFYQSGLGLSDRDYYLAIDDRSTEIREAYQKHIEKMFLLIDKTPSEASKISKSVLQFETRLAKASLSRIELRNPEKTYHKTNEAELQKIAPNFQWNHFFNTIGIQDIKDFNVGMPSFMSEASKMLTDISINNWKAYLSWDVLNSAASFLSSNFVNQNFEFYGTFMSGQKEIRARWKRIQGMTNSILSEVVGQLYVEKYFPPQAKTRMITLVENLKIALGERIETLDWMSAETKTKALAKLASMRVKIGYPDKWKDYSNLTIEDDSYFANIVRARAFFVTENFNKINKPVDKTEWFMSPQTVNAYYSPLMNEIAFPAAILQPPFFYLNADDAINYGAIGVVIGHEMTHGFDDQGRKYDQNGNMNNWWSDEDKTRFEERTQVLIDQFSKFEVAENTYADGKLTLGENIADLGGINISLQAFKNAGQKTNNIDGFTSIQRFFLAYAQLWASNVRDKEILRLTKEDVHSLGRFRVLGPLKNVPEFHQAFQINERDEMYLPTDKRAVIW